MLTFAASRPGVPAPGRQPRAIRRVAGGTCVLAGLLSLALSVFAAPSPPPAPSEYVTDPAGFLTPFTQRDLGLRLRAYEQRTGRQVLVWIGSAGGEPIEDFAVRAFQAWKIGRAGQDDGLALFVFPEERRLRFEVGYGLEGALPDAYSARILNEIAVPRLRAGGPDEAVRASLEAALGLIDGRPPREVFAAAAAPASPGLGAPGGDARALDHAAARRRTAPRPLSTLEWILLVVGGVFMLWLLFTHPALAFYLLQVLVSGGRGGGGGGGDGGFRGGGGRSGGGGASASW